MTYKINSRRITKMSRPELLRVCERLHGEMLEHRATAEQATHNEFMASQAYDACLVERNEARALAKTYAFDGGVAAGERDRYKKDYINNSLKLMAAETELSRSEARVAHLKRSQLGFWGHAGWLVASTVIYALTFGWITLWR